MDEEKDSYIDDKLKERLDQVIQDINRPGEVIILDEGKSVCEKCKNTFVINSEETRFCSKTCRLRYIALERYNRLKNNEEYKNKVKEKNKKYYQANKEKLKPIMREYGKAYYYKKREKKEDENETKEPAAI